MKLLSRKRHDPADVAMARGLGWVSLAIGLTEVIVPRRLERLMGIREGQHESVLRAMGVRELLHGAHILTQDDPAPGVKGRVVGDLIDGALLAMAGRKTRNMSGFMTVLALVAPVVIMDMICATRMSD